MHTQTGLAALGALLVGWLVAASPAGATVSSDRSGAIVTFPYVIIDAEAGLDTALRLTNTDELLAVDVACFLENHTRRCVVGGQACVDNTDCDGRDECKAAASMQVTEFGLRLTPKQPIAWRLSTGLATLPLPANTGSIPAVADDIFVGALRCVAYEASGAPSERNVLQGGATHERYDAAVNLLDAATYNGLTLAARAGELNGDSDLVLGGPDGEYEGCPARLRINHFFDLTLDPATNASQIFTTAAVLPCSADLWPTGAFPPSHGAVLQYLVYNEFEQRFSTSEPVVGHSVQRLSSIDTSQPNRSIFSASVAGTMTGQTEVQIVGDGGIMAVAVESHHDLIAPDRVTSAAFNVHSEGERATADVLDRSFDRCPEAPASACKSAGAGRLVLDQRPQAGGGRVRWEWRKGQSTSVADLGDPLQTTAYMLCVYAGTSAPIAKLSIEPGSNWTPSRRGFNYRDRVGSNDGIVKLILQSSTSGRARVSLRAQGGNVPPLGVAAPLQTPVRVQLLNTDGTCLSGTFQAGDVETNEPGRFEARAR